MAVVVGFISEKGGVGKTTACYHIAVALSRFEGKRVLVIDADYQRGGISGRFFPRLIEAFGTGTPTGTTLFNKFQQLYSASSQTPDVDIHPCGGGIDLIPADPRLSTVSVDKLPSTNNIRENNMSLLSHMKTIAFVLDRLRPNYDYILIDSHPEVSDVMRSIIYVSDHCVSPVKLDRQSSIGVATVIGEIANVNNDISMIRRSLGVEDGYRDTRFSGAMGMMAREYGEELKQSEQLEYNRLRRSGEFFSNYVTEGDGLRVAAANRQPVFDVPGANAAKQAAQFKALTKEFLQGVPMTIDLEKLIEWLGVEGTIAGLDGSDLTTAELGELTPESKRPGHAKLKRRDLIKAMVEQKRLDLTKKPEELMAMDADSLKAYFLSIKASKKEILDLLESLDIRPGSVARNNLTEFAAREISDIGMYRRVAQGNKSPDGQDGSSPG